MPRLRTRLDRLDADLARQRAAALRRPTPPTVTDDDRRRRMAELRADAERRGLRFPAPPYA